MVISSYKKVGNLDEWFSHFKEAIRYNSPKYKGWKYSLECWRKYTYKPTLRK